MPRQPEVHFRIKPTNKNKDNEIKSVVEKSKVDKSKIVSGNKEKKPNVKCSIFLQFLYSGQRLYYSFGQMIDWDNWDKKKEQVKNKLETTADGKFRLNDLLDELKKLCIKTYNEALKTGIPSPEYLKKALVDFVNQNHNEETNEVTFFKLADRFIGGEIKGSKGRDKSKSSLKNYHAVTKHLKTYESKTKYKITFESLTLDFFYKYVTFLKNDLKLSINTIAKDISILKVFMGEAVELGYTNNMDFRKKKFTFGEEETDQIYLTERELISLYKFDLSASKKLEQVRDLFVFGAWVGLRFSDFSQIKPENIVSILNEEEGKEELFIKIVTQKTKELVIIPCHPIVLDIFDKYHQNANRLPKSISNQKFNEYIKQACKAAGEADNNPIKNMVEVGRLSSKPELKLWECVSSHTARRSMASNYYLQGFPTIDLMKITGHKTERAFLKYIRVSKLDTARRLSKHIKKNWSSLMLKVA
jgi:hypothetical protein